MSFWLWTEMHRGECLEPRARARPPLFRAGFELLEDPRQRPSTRFQ